MKEGRERERCGEDGAKEERRKRERLGEDKVTGWRDVARWARRSSHTCLSQRS